jgi:hypothetical protein
MVLQANVHLHKLSDIVVNRILVLIEPSSQYVRYEYDKHEINFYLLVSPSPVGIGTGGSEFFVIVKDRVLTLSLLEPTTGGDIGLSPRTGKDDSESTSVVVAADCLDECLVVTGSSRVLLYTSSYDTASASIDI